MTQPRRHAAIEAATQATISLPIWFVVTFGVSLLHLHPATAAALITVAMYVLSFVRGYLIRRRFDRDRTP
jgi:hypothetical protein